MNANSQDIYKALLEQPGNAQHMRVLADSLEEEGEVALSNAYRWAADNGKWPFKRIERQLTNFGLDYTGETREVYDWESLDPKRILIYHPPIPGSAKLPSNMWRAIKRLSNKEYGGVHEAFVLLSKVLRS